MLLVAKGLKVAPAGSKYSAKPHIEPHCFEAGAFGDEQLFVIGEGPEDCVGQPLARPGRPPLSIRQEPGPFPQAVLPSLASIAFLPLSSGTLSDACKKWARPQATPSPYSTKTSPTTTHSSSCVQKFEMAELRKAEATHAW